MTLTTAAVLVFAGVLATWLCIGSYTRKAHLDGFVSSDEAGEVHAELFVDARSRALLHRDQVVRLRYEVDPAGRADVPRTFGGVVDAVSSVPLRAAELPALPASIAARAATGSSYRVTVRLDARGTHVGDGAMVEAVVLVAQRRLIEWLAPGPA